MRLSPSAKKPSAEHTAGPAALDVSSSGRSPLYIILVCNQSLKLTLLVLLATQSVTILFGVCDRFLIRFSTSHDPRITRAFLIEEATIVKRVLKAKAAGPKR